MATPVAQGTMRAAMSGSELLGEMECLVQEARHLPKMDSDSETNSFFIARFDGMIVCTSQPVLNSYDPVFRHSFRFRCAAGKSLKISLFDDDVSSDPDLIGSVTLRPEVLYEIMQECGELKGNFCLTKIFVLSAHGAVIPEGRGTKPNHESVQLDKTVKGKKPEPPQKVVPKKIDKKGGKNEKPPPVTPRDNR
jgi:hypothetical protein